MISEYCLYYVNYTCKVMLKMHRLSINAIIITDSLIIIIITIMINDLNNFYLVTYFTILDLVNFKRVNSEKVIAIIGFNIFYFNFLSHKYCITNDQG